jgi:CHRD domain-containing protein
MRRKGILAGLAAALAALGIAAFALADGPGFNHLSDSLTGYQEVAAVSTGGHATFTADLSKDGTIAWEMTYGGMESDVTQSHIHFGQRSVNGGISVFLCTNLGNGPVGTQACPLRAGTISGVITAADVSPNIPATAAARTQGINTGELEEFLRAMDAGKTYANIHTVSLPGGEIRAQLNETGNPHD